MFPSTTGAVFVLCKFEGCPKGARAENQTRILTQEKAKHKEKLLRELDR